MQHFIKKENMGLVFPRFIKGQKSNYGFISDEIIDRVLGGRFAASTYIAPLYIYNTNGEYDQNGKGFLFRDKEKKDNFTKEFRLFLKRQKPKKLCS